MARVKMHDNYQATLDGEVYTFQASTDRQAWYLAYEWSQGELLDGLVEIDEYGVAIRELLKEDDD